MVQLNTAAFCAAVLGACLCGTQLVAAHTANSSHSHLTPTQYIENKPNPAAAGFRPADFVRDLIEEYGSGTGSQRVLSLDGLAELYVAMGMFGGNTEVATDSHAGHDHGHDHDGHNHRIARRQEVQAEPINPTTSEFDPCLMPYDIMTIYGLNATAGLNRTAFERISPALVYIAAAKLCKNKTIAAVDAAIVIGGEEGGPTVLPKNMVWLYSFVAVTVVTLFCALGLVLVPVFKHSPFWCDLTLSFLIALGAGTLIADALLHLIPEILGLHSHEEGHSGHDHSPLSPEYKYIWTMSIVVACIYLFWAAEQGLRYLHGIHSHHDSSFQHSHSHSHMQHSHSTTHNHQSHLDLGGDEERECRDAVAAESGKKKKSMFGNDNGLSLWEEIRSVRPMAILILLGDSLHNFVDGLAIGASFSVSAKFGLTTSLAVFLHEVPHELADYAVLYSSGFSPIRAALLNMCSNLTAFVGMAIGVAVSSSSQLSTAQEVILALGAGTFLYIALSDLIPELANVHGVADCHALDTAPATTAATQASSTKTLVGAHHHHDHPHKEEVSVGSSSSTSDEDSAKAVVVAATETPVPAPKPAGIHPYSAPRVIAQHAGLALGWLVMLLIALYGEKIQV
ncbi:hypothetical protein HDU96_006037 [Phlyctochytrium bullatum]|nr:hypothetical protein HDU96_006037 [Phlyctochytrium bullatum]